MTGNELAAARRLAGLSQAGLACAIGVSHQTISYWERKPALDGRAPILRRIATVLTPPDASRLLKSRPTLGFVTLRFTGGVTGFQLGLINQALDIRAAYAKEHARVVCRAKTRRGTACKLRARENKVPTPRRPLDRSQDT